MEVPVSPDASEVDLLKVDTHSLAQAVVAIGLATVLGGVLGLGWDHIPMDLPFFLEEVLLGLTCSTATAFLIGKFQDMPSWQLYPRLWPAALFGAAVGICLYGIWWTLDPSVGGLGIGLFAGFFGGVPVVVSFGLLGGESRPMGQLEFYNMVVSLGVGFLLGLMLLAEDADITSMPAVLGIAGLFPALAGNRINIWDVMRHTGND
jgi:hypothetical protein